MQKLSEKIVQGVLLEVHSVVSEEKWNRLIAFVESQLAVEHTLAPDVATAACPKCGRELVCNDSMCDFKSRPAGKA